MRRIAIRSLLFDRGKLLAALLGVALATTLAFVQIGLYRGFQVSSSTVIEHVGGDFWVVPKGLEVLDNAEVIAATARNLLLSHPCVADVRSIVYGFVLVRKPRGSRDTALVVGVEPRPGRPIPWRLSAGDISHLEYPLRVSVDRTDLTKLQMPADPIGTTFEINSKQVVVAAMTEAIRSFTLNPYLFTSATNARRLMGLAEGQAHYFAVTLRQRTCRAEVARWMERLPDVHLLDTPDWMRKTEDYWVGGSGAGLVLAFTAVLGLVVGAVIVGQTLYSMTKEHLLELATLKAVGARNMELAGFVLWQVTFLAIIGGGTGLGFAYFLRHVLAHSGLTVVLSGQTIGVGVLATILMCVVASVMSITTVLKLEAARVLR